MSLHSDSSFWRLMCKAVPDCLVTDYGDLVPGLQLPDPGDRHVLAVAIRSAAQTIVTWNLSDFPLDRLAPCGVEAQDPDTFVLGLLNLHEAAVSAHVVRQAADLKNPPRTVDDVLQTLHDNGSSARTPRCARRGSPDDRGRDGRGEGTGGWLNSHTAMART